MRKYINKQVVYTTVTFAKIEVVKNKVQTIPLPPMEFIGKPSDDNCILRLKRYNPELKKETIVILNREKKMVVYEMLLTEFMRLGNLKDSADTVEIESDDDDDDDDDDEPSLDVSKK